MILSDLAKRAEKLIVDNSPTILAALGVTGTITTAYFAGKASFKAAQLIHDDSLEKKELNNQGKVLVDGYDAPYFRLYKDNIKLVWKLYIPAVGMGAVTVACIIGANHVGMRRAAAMASAYSITEKAFSEYKDKVVERFGEAKEQKVRDEIAQDRVNRNPLSSKEVVIIGSGDVLCYDSITGRYFSSCVEALRKAQNDINEQILNNMYASLGEFYNLIGLPETPYSNEVGWNSDHLLNLSFSTVLSEDGRPCVSVDYDVSPIRNYHRLQ